MGNVVAKINSKFLSKIKSIFTTGRQHSVTMIGLDAAGKTTLLYFLKTGEVQHTVPTLGFNCEAVEVGDMKFHFWDIGGQKAFWRFWENYIQNSNAIVFLVDLADQERFVLASESLWAILNNLSSPKPLLVLANKIDALKTPEDRKEAVSMLQKELCLDKYSGPKNFVEVSVLNAGSGNETDKYSSDVFEAFGWLNKELKNLPSHLL